MCGISGIVLKEINQKNGYKTILKNMTDSLQHRGPDDEGAEYFENCYLGFRRLSIVDLSPDGHQPMYSQDKNNCIVFNGEIYGYRDIKNEMPEVNFKSNTDTEVILELFKKHGKELPKYLNGMFSFAIWDEKSQELFCARDRFGEKPFYYATGKNGEFIFASEIKAILATGLVENELNDEALNHYLRHLFVDSQQSIYKNIKVLPPASQLIFKNGELSISQYWDFPEKESKYSEEEIYAKFENLVKKSVEKQLIADVKVGAFLSGGLDSGTLVALSSQENKNLTTLGFKYEGSWDEMPEAREIAKKYGTDHNEITFTKEELPKVLQKVLSQLDEPLADTAIMATYKICEEAAKKMTVVITGNAGDELFGGYKWYQEELNILQKGGSNPGFLNIYKIGATFGKVIGSSKIQNHFLYRVFRAKFSDIISYQKNKVHNNFTAAEVENLLGKTENYEHSYSFDLDKKNVNSCMKMDLTNIIPGDYLVKDDRIAMMHSIELRTPFLDKDLVEFCASLPSKYKVSQSQTKIILRKVFGNLLTENILNKKKQGFGAPVSEWMKFPEMVELSDKILKNPKSEMFKKVDFNGSQKYLDFTFKHWSLLVLGIWMEAHFQK